LGVGKRASSLKILHSQRTPRNRINESPPL
jgi:hypothetical protein